MAWDVAEREDAQVAADLVGRACLRERVNCRRPKPLILHAANGNAMWFRHSGEPAAGVGGAQILLQAQGQQRQPLPGVAVPNGEIPAGLPKEPLPGRGGGLRLGHGIRGLVQHHRHSRVRFVKKKSVSES